MDSNPAAVDLIGNRPQGNEEEIGNQELGPLPIPSTPLLLHHEGGACPACSRGMPCTQWKFWMSANTRTLVSAPFHKFLVL